MAGIAGAARGTSPSNDNCNLADSPSVIVSRSSDAVTLAAAAEYAAPQRQHKTAHQSRMDFGLSLRLPHRGTFGMSRIAMFASARDRSKPAPFLIGGRYI